MEEQAALALTFAADLAKQLISLSTGVIALTITFTKDLVARAPSSAVRSLRISWILYLISLLFGIFSLMALTGELAPIDMSKSDLVLGGNVRVPAGLQILTFFAGTVAVVHFGFKAIIHSDQEYRSQDKDELAEPEP